MPQKKKKKNQLYAVIKWDLLSEERSFQDFQTEGSDIFGPAERRMKNDPLVQQVQKDIDT